MLPVAYGSDKPPPLIFDEQHLSRNKVNTLYSQTIQAKNSYTIKRLKEQCNNLSKIKWSKIFFTVLFGFDLNTKCLPAISIVGHSIDTNTECN